MCRQVTPINLVRIWLFISMLGLTKNSMGKYCRSLPNSEVHYFVEFITGYVQNVTGYYNRAQYKLYNVGY